MTTRVRLAVGVTVAAIGGVTAAARLPASPPRAPLPLPRAADLRDGDLIFRSGVSAESAFVRWADPRAGYSHVGLIDRSGAEPLVVHIEPGPAPVDALIRREPLALFLAADRAKAYAVFHLVAADRARGAAAVAAALRYRDDGVSFDERADLTTVREQYCTELVWRAYRAAGVDLVDGDFGPAPAFLGRRIVRLTALLHSAHLERRPAVAR